MVHTCNRCQGRMHLVRKWPHPTLWPPKVLARYICPECGMVRECTEDGDSDCVDMTPETMRDVEYYRAQSESCAQMAEKVGDARRAATIRSLEGHGLGRIRSLGELAGSSSIPRVRTAMARDRRRNPCEVC